MTTVSGRNNRLDGATTIESLPLSNRTRSRLLEAGLRTLDELAVQTDDALLSLHGFGHTCLREVRSILRLMPSDGGAQHAAPGGADVAFPRDVPDALRAMKLAHLPISNRARRVFEREGLVTVDDYVRTGEDALLRLRNFGETSLHLVNRAIAAAARRVRAPEDAASLAKLAAADNLGDESVLAQALAQVPVAALDLPRRARRACQELGLRTLRDLARISTNELLGQRNFGQATLRRIREEVERFVADHERDQRPADFAGVLDALFARLQPKERMLVELREGRDGQGARTLTDAGQLLDITESRACQIEHAAWAKLRRFGAGLTDGAGDHAVRIILENGGVCDSGVLNADPWFAAARCDAEFLARILTRLLPHRLARLADGRLAGAPAATVYTLAARLKKRLGKNQGAVPLPQLTEDTLRGLDLGDEGPTLVRALCQDLFHREITVPSDAEAQVRTSSQGLSDDLRRVLQDAGRAMHFREIARRLAAPPFLRNDLSEEKVRLRLCRDARFVLVRRGLYDLRERFNVAPALRRELADRALAILERANKPTSVALLRAGLAGEERFAAVNEFVLAAVLRDDARFRHLGRGTFVRVGASEQSVLHVSEILEHVLREAGKPLSYAELRKRVQDRRRVSDGAISATLVGRSTFLRVARGVFDLAERHPFDDARRAALADSARHALQSAGGVLALRKLGDALRQRIPDLPQPMHPVLLGDLLRRAGGFDFLGDGYVSIADADAETALVRRAYDLLRSVGEPLRPTTIARRLQLEDGAAALLRKLLKSSDRFATLADGRFEAVRNDRGNDP